MPPPARILEVEPFLITKLISLKFDIQKTDNDHVLSNNENDSN